MAYGYFVLCSCRTMESIFVKWTWNQKEFLTVFFILLQFTTSKAFLRWHFNFSLILIYIWTSCATFQCFWFFKSGKRDKATLFGRNDNGVGVVFPDSTLTDDVTSLSIKPGDYVIVKVRFYNSVYPLTRKSWLTRVAAKDAGCTMIF